MFCSGKHRLRLWRGIPGRCPPIINKRPCNYHFLPPFAPIFLFAHPTFLTSLRHWWEMAVLILQCHLRINSSDSVHLRNIGPTVLFIYSFIQAISIASLQVHYYSEALPTQHVHCAGISHRSAKGTVSEELAQDPYLAARAGVKPMTLRTKSVDSTKAPPTPHNYSEC